MMVNVLLVARNPRLGLVASEAVLQEMAKDLEKAHIVTTVDAAGKTHLFGIKKVTVTSAGVEVEFDVEEGDDRSEFVLRSMCQSPVPTLVKRFGGPRC